MLFAELYLKNEYDNDTFSKKYNALLDEVSIFYFLTYKLSDFIIKMHILKQRERNYSSKVNFFNENEDSFQSEKNFLKEIENQK